MQFTLTGGSDRFMDFTASVFKFDASTFYSWDQDNLPIWDLADRTEFLYGQLGAPLSSISGITFTLSDSADASLNVFSNIDDIRNRIPKVCNFPVRIELAKFGNLGDLNLDSIDFRGDGELLIVNLLYAKDRGMETLAVSSGGTWRGGSTRAFPSQLSSSTTTEGWGQTLSSNATTNPALAGAKPFVASSLSANYRSILEKSKVSVATNIYLPELMYLSIASTNYSPLQDTTDSRIFYPELYTNLRDLSISSADAFYYAHNGFQTIINLEQDGLYSWFVPVTTSYDTDGCIYGNYFNSVKIRNCKGNSKSVIMSGLLVDSGEEFADLSSLTHNSDHGFEIQNSIVNPIDCFAIRCKNSGWNLKDSLVSPSGTWGAARIYNPAWNQTTLTIDHGLTGLPGVGLYAVNSDISLPVSGSESQGEIVSFTRCHRGIELVNSRIRGGNQDTTAKSGAGTGADEITCLFAYQNVEEGIKLHGAIFDFSGMVASYSNGDGVVLENSLFRTSKFHITHNFGYGVKSLNSAFIYGINHIQHSNEETYAGTLGVYTFPSYWCSHNNRNWLLKQSNLEPYIRFDTSALDSKLNVFGNCNVIAYGATENGVGANAVQMTLDNSYALLVHYGAGTFAGGSADPKSIPGALVQARNGSTVKFIGTQKADTNLQGTTNGVTYVGGFHGTASNLKYFQRMAAVAAFNNSTIEFSGPTKILFFGVPALAKNNSTIRFSPQMTQEGNVDTRLWSLSSADNHTQIHLHATRSCLVAEDNSVIEMKYLGDGDYTPNGGGNKDFSDGVPYVSTRDVSAGYLQFYPNPYMESIGGLQQTKLAGLTTQVQQRGGFLTSSTQVSGTLGGMCVRALGGSRVNVNHVNFPMGIDVESVSGVYYDASSTCWRPFIWNFCDNSTLRASNIKISGYTTSDHGYQGPVGAWGSGGTGPSIDYYGISGTRQIANGATELPANFGPFRLYFSIDSKYRSLVPSGSGYSGNVIYTLAQGYLPSSVNLSSIGAESVYYFNKSLSDATDGDIILGTSSVSSILAGSRYSITLDETAINAFANAKHCSEDHVAKVAIIRESIDTSGAGEGTEHPAEQGVGIRSINTFDLARVN